jgi:hypothetical protein
VPVETVKCAAVVTRECAHLLSFVLLSPPRAIQDSAAFTGVPPSISSSIAERSDLAPQINMSLLLKLALSARTRRGVQQAVPAVCSALGLLSSSAVESGSSGAAGGFAGAATVARPHHQQPFALQGVRRGFHAGSATLDVAGVSVLLIASMAPVTVAAAQV